MRAPPSAKQFQGGTVFEKMVNLEAKRVSRMWDVHILATFCLPTLTPMYIKHAFLMCTVLKALHI
jgi:hypothetical protein